MPIKRNEHLQMLSRDHHFGLLFCWKVRQGLQNKISASRIRHYINYYWENFLRQHFAAEEVYLFNPIKDEPCNKGIAQHRKIEKQIQCINEAAEPQAADFKALADLVDQHIRFEERELFPYLESVLIPEKLAFIGEELKALHAQAPVENYSDAFWLTVKNDKAV